MTQQEYLQHVLSPILGQSVTVQGQTVHLPADHILLEVGTDRFTACPLSEFVARFGPAIPEPTPADNRVFDLLTAFDPGDSMGWRRHFENWQARGLIA